MDRDTSSVGAAATELRDAWRAAAPFFASIELWLMVLAAAGSVAGAWLVVLGEAWSVLPLGLAFAYVPARTVLHVRRILAWPFF